MANNTPKLSVLQALNNKKIYIYLNTLFCAFSLNVYENPKYYQDQYYHNQLKNCRHTHIIQSFSCYQPKDLLKYCLNIMKLYLFQNLFL